MQDFVLSSIYESYDFESIPEIPFEWLLLFDIYPEVNWKITRQLKDHRSPAQAENSNRFFTQFIWPSGEQTSVLNPLTGHLVSSKSCDQCPVSLGRVWPVTSALVAIAQLSSRPTSLWITQFYYEFVKSPSETLMTDGALSQQTLNTFCINPSEIHSPLCACLHLQIRSSSRDTKMPAKDVNFCAPVILTSSHSSKLIGQFITATKIVSRAIYNEPGSRDHHG